MYYIRQAVLKFAPLAHALLPCPDTGLLLTSDYCNSSSISPPFLLLINAFFLNSDTLNYLRMT